MSIKIRLIEQKDINDVRCIYAPYILNTAITFEYEVPAIEEFEARVLTTTQQFPYLICEIDDVIAGYAYATTQYERKAYQWNCELSVYIAPDYFGKHIATAFYHSLIELLKLQGYINVYARVNADNEASNHLHHSFGFHSVGISKNTGYKFGIWHDITTLQKQIGEYDLNPNPPISIHEIDKTKLPQIFVDAVNLIQV